MKAIFMLLTLIATQTLALAQNKKTKPRVEFLSTNDVVYEMLEDKQRAVYAGDKNAYRWKDSPEEVALLEKISKQYQLKKGSIRKRIDGLTMTTKFENPIVLFILMDNIRSVELTLRKDNIAFTSPRYGTLPTSTLNASMNNSIPSAPLMIMNSGIFNFCHELSKISLKTIHLSSDRNNVYIDYDQEILNRMLSKDDSLIVRFSMALEDYANRRTIKGHATPSKLEADLLVKIVNCMEIFIVAHEYGHLILKHQATSEEQIETRLHSDVNDTSLKVSLNSWKQEIEADLFGLLILDDYLKSNPSMFDGILQLAPYLYFSLAQIADESSFIFDKKAFPDSIQPNERSNYIQLVSMMAFKSLPNVSTAAKKSWFSYHPQNNVDLDTNLLVSLDHPPNWLRRDLILDLIEQNKIAIDSSFEPLGRALVENLQKIWSIMKVPWVKIVNGIPPDSPSRVKNSLQHDSLTSQQPGPETMQSLLKFIDTERLKVEPPQCQELKSNGYALFEEKEYRKSIEVLLKAEACGVKSSTFYFVLASCYLDIKDYKNAVKYYNFNIPRDNTLSGYFWNYGNRGMAHRELGNYTQALTDFNNALQLATHDDPKLYRERALLFLLLKRYPEAIADYKKSVELDPTDILYRVELYEAYAIQGDFSKVIEGRDYVLRLKPSKDYLLIFDFFEYASRVQLNESTEKIELEIESLLKLKYDLVWYFDNFKLAMEQPPFKQELNPRILTMEKRIKQQLIK